MIALCRLLFTGVMLFVSLPVYAQIWAADFEAAPQQRTLIPGLLEVSGLAAGPDNTVFAHNDEHAILYQINLDDGSVIKAFALGDPTLEKDFEGIEVINGRVYLLSSKGKLYEGLLGAHKSRVKFNAYDTGVGDFCETEGLVRGPDADDGSSALLILCKKPHAKNQRDRMFIYSWSLKDRSPVTEPWMEISRSALTDGNPDKFNPSGLEWSDTHQQIFVVSAKSARFASLTRDGTVRQKVKLDKSYHRQSEGLALLPSGHIVIADEGKGAVPPRLSIYKAEPTAGP